MDLYMSKHSIKLKRAGIQGFLAGNELMTDALTAVSTIPGVDDVWEESESADVATVGYTWIGIEQFMETTEHLIKFGLERVD